MINLNGQPAELSFVLTIKRKETGEVIEVPMVGHVTQGDEPPAIAAEPEDKEPNK